MSYPSLRKRHLSLLEVLIALVLTVAILMTLTFFYRQVTEMGAATDHISAENFKMRYIETRLAAILPKTVSHSKSDFTFFSLGDEGLTKPGSQTLIFTFDNQVSLDKAFSNHVLARLYLDKNGNLMIAYWPSPKQWENQTPPIKKELLLQGVENLAFEFYIPPAKKEKVPQEKETIKKPLEKQKENENSLSEGKKISEPEPKGDWRKQPWLQDYKQLPVMVKLIVTLRNHPEPLIFIYPLANAKSHIVYE